MNIRIYWFESNSWIYIYIVLNKNWKMYWSEKKFLLILGRTDAHRDDWFTNYSMLDYY
jgi:hypothetical protein